MKFDCVLVVVDAVVLVVVAMVEVVLWGADEFAAVCSSRALVSSVQSREGERGDPKKTTTMMMRADFEFSKVTVAS